MNIPFPGGVYVLILKNKKTKKNKTKEKILYVGNMYMQMKEGWQIVYVKSQL